MPSNEKEIIGLANEVFNFLTAIDDIGLNPFLSKWPSDPYKLRAILEQTLPVHSYLQKLSTHTNTKTQKIIQMLNALKDHICWGQTYSVEDFGDRFLEKYGWAELIGLRGPIASSEIACGFLLLGPNILYPKHSHEAEEVYIPLSEKHAFWIKENNDWVSRPVGKPIYHKSWLPHGMRTSSEPLIALYLWIGGNLVQKSQIE